MKNYKSIFTDNAMSFWFYAKNKEILKYDKISKMRICRWKKFLLNDNKKMKKAIYIKNLMPLKFAIFSLSRLLNFSPLKFCIHQSDKPILGAKATFIIILWVTT